MQGGTVRMRKTKGGLVHPITQRALAKLGEDISLARRARRISTTDCSERAGISPSTLRRLERGEAGTTLNTLAMVLHVLGRLDLLKNLIDLTKDDLGLMIMRNQIPKRITRRASVKKTSKGPIEESSGYMEW